MGCLNFSDIKIIYPKDVTVLTNLLYASADYYHCEEKWPKSLDELRSQDCGRKDPEKQQAISNKLAMIDCWPELTGKVVFKEMTSNGLPTLAITIPPLKIIANGVMTNSKESTGTISIGNPVMLGEDAKANNK